VERTAESRIKYPPLDISKLDKLMTCVAYDFEEQRAVSRECRETLPIVCSRPTLKQPLSRSVREREFVSRFFCPVNWVTHWLVLDRKTCYRRFVNEEAVTWDQATDLCHRNGGRLATGQTQHLRIVLEQVYEYFSNQSAVDSWIGLRMDGNGQPASFVWSDGSRNQIYNWQPYNEFGNGYGVSTGLSRKWWTWPSHVKLWGFICQKQVPDWSQDFNLQLKSFDEGTNILQVNYEPKLNVETNFWSRNTPNIRPDHAACYIANYFRICKYPAVDKNSVQIEFKVPSDVNFGEMVCEIWFNQPPIRIKSNHLTYQSKETLNYIIHVGPVDNSAVKFPIWKDLNLKFDLNWSIRDEFDHVYINYRISMNKSKHFSIGQLNSIARKCSGSDMSPNLDQESGILFLIQSCLKSDQHKFKLMSTVACQAETIDELEWPKTAIGSISRPEQLCLTWEGNLLQRFCGGSYLTGASWDETSVISVISFT
jgi:hypothetical protein